MSPPGTQSFSPKEYDPLISISPILNKSDPLFSMSPETQISHDRVETPPSTSVNEVIHGTPKKCQKKPAILHASEYTGYRLEEERIRSSKGIKSKDKPIKIVANVQVKNKGNDSFEKERLQSICKKTHIGQCENDEEIRLNKLSSPSDIESAEYLIQEMSKQSNSEEDSCLIELSKSKDSNQVVSLSQKSEDSQGLKQSQNSISDNTLMEISSGQMKTVVAISNSGNSNDNLDGLRTSMEQSGMITDETGNKKSQKYVFKKVLPNSVTGKERGKQTPLSNQHRSNQSNENNESSDKHLCLHKKENIAASVKSFTGPCKVKDLMSSIKSSKRNRCEISADDVPSGKSRKVDSHAVEATENNSNGKNENIEASNLTQESETSPRLLQSTRSTRKPPSEISFENIGGKKIRMKINQAGNSSSPKGNSDKGEKKEEEEQSQSILTRDILRLPLKQVQGETVHDVIVISSGESGKK